MRCLVVEGAGCQVHGARCRVHSWGEVVRVATPLVVLSRPSARCTPPPGNPLRGLSVVFRVAMSTPRGITAAPRLCISKTYPEKTHFCVSKDTLEGRNLTKLGAVFGLNSGFDGDLLVRHDGSLGPKLRVAQFGTILDLKITFLQKCEAVPRRARM